MPREKMESYKLFKLKPPKVENERQKQKKGKASNGKQ